MKRPDDHPVPESGLGVPKKVVLKPGNLGGQKGGPNTSPPTTGPPNADDSR